MKLLLLTRAKTLKMAVVVLTTMKTNIRFVLIAIGLVIYGQALFAQSSQVNLFSDEIVSRLADKQQQIVENIRKRKLNAEMKVARLRNFNQILSSKSIRFNLLPNANFSIQRTRIEQTGERSYIWHGEFNRGNRAMLSIHDKAIAGYVHDGKNLYEIQSVADDVCAIYRVDNSQP